MIEDINIKNFKTILQFLVISLDLQHWESNDSMDDYAQGQWLRHYVLLLFATPPWDKPSFH